MCVIMVKPMGVSFPEDKVFKNCWTNNPDGAGFMYTWKERVHIVKGLMTYKALMEALTKARKVTGDKVPYVVHFRIATQGFNPCCTHPFPVSSSMKSLKALSGTTRLGMAHNGIIHLTSDGNKTYSDTMLFIQKYLYNIVHGDNWYTDVKTCNLITNLIESSRIVLLNDAGKLAMFGEGWVRDSKVYYSNSSYKERVYSFSTSPCWDKWEFDDEYDTYGIENDKTTGDEIRDYQINRCTNCTKTIPCTSCENAYLSDDENLWKLNYTTGKYEFTLAPAYKRQWDNEQ